MSATTSGGILGVTADSPEMASHGLSARRSYRAGLEDIGTVNYADRMTSSFKYHSAMVQLRWPKSWTR